MQSTNGTKGAEIMRNNAPKTEWRSHVMACGTSRQRLYVNGSETPFFIDSNNLLGHRSFGDPHGLYGAGLGDMVSAGYRIAGCFGSGKKTAPLKHRAEQMALG